MLEKTNTNQPAKWFERNEGKLNFDLDIQRGYVWGLDLKSDLIHTMLEGYPIPALYSVEKNGSLYNFVDGKQRASTIISYQRDEFALHADTDDVVEIEVTIDEETGEEIENEVDRTVIAKLKFSELPKEFQERIQDYYFSIFIYKKLTTNQRDKMFTKLNKSVKLSSMQTLRSELGEDMRIYLKEITSSAFFKNKIAFTFGDRKENKDEVVALQILSILMNEDISFSSKDIREFGLKIKNNGGVSSDVKGDMTTLLEYLDEAFPSSTDGDTEPDKILKNIHIAGIAKIAYEYMDTVEPIVFGDAIMTFLKLQNEEMKEYRKIEKENKDRKEEEQVPNTMSRYNSGCYSGTAKKYSIEKRVSELGSYVDNFVKGNNEQNESLKLVG